METLKIQIVDDEAGVRKLVCLWVERLGHTVVAQSENGLEAVAHAKIYKPDLIIMDTKMPILDGIEAAKQISLEHSCALVFLSGYTEDEFVDQASGCGALAYLSKPFRSSDLKPALTIAMTRYRDLVKSGKEITYLQETLESRKLIERAKGILSDRHHLSEEEAFKRIHFMARNQNKKMREIAQSIITASQVL